MGDRIFVGSQHLLRILAFFSRPLTSNGGVNLLATANCLTLTNQRIALAALHTVSSSCILGRW